MSLTVKAGKGRPSGTLIQQAYSQGLKDGFADAMKALTSAFDFVQWSATRKGVGHPNEYDIVRGNEGSGGTGPSEPNGHESPGVSPTFSS